MAEVGKIVGVTRVRNEEPIIQATLDRVAGLVDEIVVYDDCSTDVTAEICEKHPAVVKVIQGTTWDPEPQRRAEAEGNLRQIPFMEACNRGAEWVYLFDGDELLELDEINMFGEKRPKPKNLRGLIEMTRGSEAVPVVNGFLFRLFDFYITAEDVDGTWRDRRWMGPEYRDIMMFFRVVPGVQFNNREPSNTAAPYALGGWVKHYGKAISVEHWEETCDYYVNNRGGDLLPQFTVKWAQRRGKAVHDGKSDFGGPLITWDQRNEKGFLLKDDAAKYQQSG